jgi:HEAT repeat protein
VTTNPEPLVVAMLVVALASLVLSALLFLVKFFHRRRMRAAGVRRAVYIGALGELAARNSVPTTEIEGWPDDPVFLEVLFDFLAIVTGDERATLDKLIEQLELRQRLADDLSKARRRNTRLRTLSYLVEIADASLEPVFVACLAEPVTEEKLHAARALAQIGNPDDLSLILDEMEQAEAWVASRLADEIVEFGTAAVPGLVNYLLLAEHDVNRDPELLRQVIRVIGSIGDLRAEPALIPMLESPEPLVRVGAASALSEAGSPVSVPALVRALEDPDWRVRARAADALGTFSDDRALEPLARALRDQAWWVRQDAARALASHLGGKPELVAALSGDDPFARDAALSQLGIKGDVTEAEHRFEVGMATGQDRMIMAASEAAHRTSDPEVVG